MRIPANPARFLVTSLTAPFQVFDETKANEVIQCIEWRTRMPRFEVVAPAKPVFVDILNQILDRDVAPVAARPFLNPVPFLLQTLWRGFLVVIPFALPPFADSLLKAESEKIQFAPRAGEIDTRVFSPLIFSPIRTSKVCLIHVLSSSP